MWLVEDKFCLSNKIKEVPLKFYTTYIQQKKTLERFRIDTEYSCTFCEIEEETICHLSYHCMYTSILCGSSTEGKLGKQFNFRIKTFLYVLMEKDNFLYSLYYFGEKFHIHKKRYTDSKPSFETFFYQELHQYGTTIRGLENKKAVKTNFVFDEKITSG